MQKPQTVKEVFLPLAARLQQFEQEHYQFESDSIQDLNEFRTDFNFELLIGTIYFECNLFNEIEVINEANKFINRINDLLGKLKPREFDYSYNSNTQEVIKTPTSNEHQNFLLSEWKTELKFYILKLNEINNIAKCGQAEYKESAEPSLKEIHIEGNLSATKLKEHFIPKFSNKTSALFLHYLKESKYIPNYNKTSLSKFAPPLLGNNNQNIFDHLVYINDLLTEKNELKKLKNDLNIIISYIDKEIEKK